MVLIGIPPHNMDHPRPVDMVATDEAQLQNAKHDTRERALQQLTDKIDRIRYWRTFETALNRPFTRLCCTTHHILSLNITTPIVQTKGLIEK